MSVLALAGELPARLLAQLRSARDTERAYAALCETEARTDSLTGLGNRRHGEQLLDTLQPGDAVVMLDLDHFKAINDRFGHAGGDRVLRDLGVYLLASIETGNGVARFGGEEFLLIFRDETDPLAAAEELAAGWRERQPLTAFSAGVSVHRQDRPLSITFSEADTALYRAKREGRDRTRMFGTQIPDTAAVS